MAKRGLSVLFCLLAIQSSEAFARQETVHAPTLRAGLLEVVRKAGPEQPGNVIAAVVSLELSTAPLGSSSGGFTFTFEPRTRSWTRSASTFGPAFAERALTIGRRKATLGFNVLAASYDQLEGADVKALRVTTVSGSGVPAVRLLSQDNLSPINDLQLRLKTQTAVIFGSVGLTDRLDVGAALPFVRVSLDATSQGYAYDLTPELTFRFDGTSSGLGDIALFGKYRVWSTDGGGAAVAVDMRLPSGDEDNLRGLGNTRTLLSGIWSETWGPLSPHVNVGYEFWSHGIVFEHGIGGSEPEATAQIKWAAGVEYEITPRLTLLGDMVSRTIRGAGRLDNTTIEFNDPEKPNEDAIKYGIGSIQTLAATPKSLTQVMLAPGIKWNAFGSALVTGSLLIPISDAGLRDRLTPVIGIDWAF